MSETGIYAGGYQRVRDYARAFNRLLLDLKSGTPPSEDAVLPVRRILEGLRNENTAGSGIQLLSVLLRHHGGIARQRLSDIADELAQHKASPQSVEDLESLANLLDQERAELLSRMRGA